MGFPHWRISQSVLEKETEKDLEKKEKEKKYADYNFLFIQILNFKKYFKIQSISTIWIINVSSRMHEKVTKIYAKKYQRFKFVTLCPGLVKTSIFRWMKWYHKIIVLQYCTTYFNFLFYFFFIKTVAFYFMKYHI